MPVTFYKALPSFLSDAMRGILLTLGVCGVLGA